MIENDQHYQVTTQRLAQFAAVLTSLQRTPRPDHLPPRLHQAMQDSLASQLADLRHEVVAYAARRARARGDQQPGGTGGRTTSKNLAQ